MKRLSITIVIFLTILISSMAMGFSEIIRKENQVTFYFQPAKFDYHSTISNFIYTFNPDGTGWVMTGIYPDAYESGSEEPLMSYNMYWETFNDTLKISLSIENQEVARQYFKVMKNADSLIQLKEYPLMRPIKLWKISKIELEQVPFSGK